MVLVAAGGLDHPPLATRVVPRHRWRGSALDSARSSLPTCRSSPDVVERRPPLLLCASLGQRPGTAPRAAVPHQPYVVPIETTRKCGVWWGDRGNTGARVHRSTSARLAAATMILGGPVYPTAKRARLSCRARAVRHRQPDLVPQQHAAVQVCDAPEPSLAQDHRRLARTHPRVADRDHRPVLGDLR